MTNFSKELEFTKELAVRLGKEALAQQSQLHKIIEKAPKDLVTEVDLSTDLAIREAIQTKFPSHGLMTEEGDNVNEGSEFRWHVDPIDGTVNFACGLPLWGVSIGLEVAGERVMGVVYFPSFQELFYATKETGAYCNNQQLKVADTTELDNAMIVNNGLNLGKTLEAQTAYNQKWFKVMGKAAPEIGRSRNFGAAVYEGSLVARGQAEGYIIMGYNAWDLAAIVPIAEAAGAKITSLDGS